VARKFARKIFRSPTTALFRLKNASWIATSIRSAGFGVGSNADQIVRSTIEMADLKRLHKEAIPAALEKAERYRLLNEPGEAESICLDILAADAENQQAIITLL